MPDELNARGLAGQVAIEMQNLADGAQPDGPLPGPLEARARAATTAAASATTAAGATTGALAAPAATADDGGVPAGPAPVVLVMEAPAESPPLPRGTRRSLVVAESGHGITSMTDLMGAAAGTSDCASSTDGEGDV
jgi:hypothetical protein